MPLQAIYLSESLYIKVKQDIPKGKLSQMVQEWLEDYFKKMEGVGMTEEEVRKELLKEEIMLEAKKKVEEIENGTY